MSTNQKHLKKFVSYRSPVRGTKGCVERVLSISCKKTHVDTHDLPSNVRDFGGKTRGEGEKK